MLILETATPALQLRVATALYFPGRYFLQCATFTKWLNGLSMVGKKRNFTYFTNPCTPTYIRIVPTVELGPCSK